MALARARAEAAARSAARNVGRLTAGRRMSPGFLIVGAQRCGTTSLYKTLCQHPAVLPAVLHKGVHYFDVGYDRGPAWYRGHFPLRRSADRLGARLGVEPITGESSPYYLFHPLVAGRIAADLPAAKVLVLLRDPVERAYSAHTHETARGFESETFERALALEGDRLAGAAARFVDQPLARSFSHQHHGYLSRGRYLEQLLRLEAAVGRERMHVIDSDDFFETPAPVFDRVLDFLGLPLTPGTVFEKHNARPRASMPTELRERLLRALADDDARLEQWWGHVPGWRR